jgi:hypothetical protein
MSSSPLSSSACVLFCAENAHNINQLIYFYKPITALPSDQINGKAIEFISNRSSVYPVPPFFMYWATGTAHAPHYALAEWIARYKGRFDAGWDVARERVLKGPTQITSSAAIWSLPSPGPGSRMTGPGTSRCTAIAPSDSARPVGRGDLGRGRREAGQALTDDYPAETRSRASFAIWSLTSIKFTGDSCPR